MRRVILALIRGYQRWLSPLKRRPTCRFLPTCSEYAREAVEVHGAGKGVLLGLGRIFRCHPLCKGGYDPVKLTEYSVIFSVVALPLTYLPILLVANDRRYMGSHANGRLANVLGVVYFAIILLVAIAAIPLLVLTNGGQG